MEAEKQALSATQICEFTSIEVTELQTRPENSHLNTKEIETEHIKINPKTDRYEKQQQQQQKPSTQFQSMLHLITSKYVQCLHHVEYGRYFISTER